MQRFAIVVGRVQERVTGRGVATRSARVRCAVVGPGIAPQDRTLSTDVMCDPNGCFVATARPTAFAGMQQLALGAEASFMFCVDLETADGARSSFTRSVPSADLLSRAPGTGVPGVPTGLPLRYNFEVDPQPVALRGAATYAGGIPAAHVRVTYGAGSSVTADAHGRFTIEELPTEASVTLAFHVESSQGTTVVERLVNPRYGAPRMSLSFDLTAGSAQRGMH